MRCSAQPAPSQLQAMHDRTLSQSASGARVSPIAIKCTRLASGGCGPTCVHHGQRAQSVRSSYCSTRTRTRLLEYA